MRNLLPSQTASGFGAGANQDVQRGIDQLSLDDTRERRSKRWLPRKHLQPRLASVEVFPKKKLGATASKIVMFVSIEFIRISGSS